MSRALLLLTALAGLAATRAARRQHQDVPDFVVERRSADGERETRVHYGSLTAVESWDANDGVLLRQVSDGRALVQAVFRDGRLEECQLLRDPDSLERFFETFAADFECARSNDTADGCGDDQLRVITDAPEQELDEHVLELLRWRRQTRACRRLLRRKQLEDDGGGGVEVAAEGPRRGRRRRDLFLYPGTNWCGSGSSARKLNELGHNSRADRCCREHDHCPFTIEAFQKKFHLFNYRLHTLSHCECDERFRSCLKMTNNGASHMVGKLYFNVVQTKCFVFKHREVCEKRSWWGKCIQREKQKVAVLRNGMSF